MSQSTLDGLIMRAVADAAFRRRLMDPRQFAEAIANLDLTPDEIERLKKTTCEKAVATLPYAQKLRDRLAK
jgi:hypothetical protein